MDDFQVESRSVDVEYVKLLHDIHIEDIPGHMYRGYTIVGGSSTSEKALREIDHYPGAKRPIWFVFSGMGSQWPGMGSALLRFPVFAAAIQKCDAVLKPRGVDIYDILTNTDKSTFDNILNSFVGIAAVQVLFYSDFEIIPKIQTKNIHYTSFCLFIIRQDWSRRSSHTHWNSTGQNNWSFGRRTRLRLCRWLLYTGANGSCSVFSGTGFY